MVRNGLKRPKKAKKCQICKSPATPVAVPPYWKSERKYYFEVGPIAKKAIFGPKVPQKSRFAVRLVMNWQSDCRFWKLWFFCIEKWPWFLVSGPKSKNGIFWQKKMASFTFDCVLPFSTIFLWSKTSGFVPRIQNLSKHFNFTCSDTVILATLGNIRKNQKTVLPDTFSCFDSFLHSK